MDGLLDEHTKETRDILRQAWALLDSKLDLAQSQLVTTRQVLGAYDPRAVLARGYAIVRGRVQTGEQIIIEQHARLITAEVTNVKEQ